MLISLRVKKQKAAKSLCITHDSLAARLAYIAAIVFINLRYVASWLCVPWFPADCSEQRLTFLIEGYLPLVLHGYQEKDFEPRDLSALRNESTLVKNSPDGQNLPVFISCFGSVMPGW